MKYVQQTINRYNQVLKIYLFLAQQIESCDSEDKAFYQDVCLLFAKKMKTMRAELAEQGLVLRQENNHAFLYNNNK